ncbi:DUF998 domain-containing protein [Streptomyces sp. NPDC127584]|uniref:DUF998 domain-containing protein n=1 Tax=Streptomyces sp. NPDC127584 TaxID=3345403 RepID=UPI00362B20A8
MRSVPRWALLSSGCAPLLLAGGWTVAALLEGPAYDPVTQTISVLAAYGAAGSWVMTGAFLALGVCHLLTAWGLRPAARAGRLALAGGGVAALGVALVPTPSSGGSLNHGAVVVAGFTLLAVWPVLAAVRGEGGPWGLRLLPSVTATVVMALGAVWFLVEMNRQGAVGVAERLVTCVQSTWPLVVVASCLRCRVSRAVAGGEGSRGGGEGGGIGGAGVTGAADGEAAPPRRPPSG